MKKIAIAGVAASGLLLSCNHDDFLSREPLGGYTASNFYETEIQITEAINPGYREVRDQFAQDIWVLGELRSDNTTFTFNPSDQGLAGRWQTDLFVSGAAVDRASEVWNGSYTAISRMNLVLANIAEAEFSEEEIRGQREGEARFLRAFFYWQLTRNFGDVPILLEPEFDIADLEALDREPVATVYEQAIEPDLRAAIDLLPAENDDADIGRATRGAAQMLLAKAYFSFGNHDDAVEPRYADAIPLLNDLIASGTYRLLPDYRSVFAPDNGNNDEIIFAAQFDVGAGQGAGFVNAFLPQGSGTDITESDDNNVGAAGGGNNRPTEDIIRAYFPDDPRFGASVGVFVRSGDTLYYPRKFVFPPLPAAGTDIDWPVFRYADALLMRAEAIAETSAGDVPDEALIDLNSVRVRVGLRPAFRGSADSTLDIDSREKFFDLLRRERRVELAFESHRWYDLVRYGIYVERMREHGEEQRAMGGYIDDFPNAFQDIPALYPLPPVQVATYGYRQNPGY